MVWLVDASLKRDINNLITISEAAELLGVSKGTLRNWDRAGKLKAKRHPINSYRVYSRTELEHLIAKLHGSVT